VNEENDELLRSFARNDNQAALAVMYEGCDDQQAEMKYTDIDLLMASKIPMLRRKDDVTSHAYDKIKKKLEAEKNLVVKRSVMEGLMNKEEAVNVVEGEYSETYHDVWLAIGWGVSWQLEEGQTKPKRYQWDNMILPFYVPSNA
jgi:hypothetical protein